MPTAAICGDSRRGGWRREEIRDTMLAVAGKLDTTMGGPGFRLYRYMQDNVATYVPLDEHGPETYRRAVYHQNARASRLDLLTEFDCPDNAFPVPAASIHDHAAASPDVDEPSLFAGHGSIASRSACSGRPAPTRRQAQVRRAFALAYSRRRDRRGT